MAMVCCFACRSHPKIFISASFVPSFLVGYRKVYSGRREADVVMSSVGWIAGVAANPAPRVIGGEPETQSCETTTSDSLHRSDSSRPLNRVDADAAPVP